MGAGKMLWRLATLVTSEVMCDNGRLTVYYRNAVSRLSGPRTYLVPHTLRCCHHVSPALWGTKQISWAW